MGSVHHSTPEWKPMGPVLEVRARSASTQVFLVSGRVCHLYAIFVRRQPWNCARGISSATHSTREISLPHGTTCAGGKFPPRPRRDFLGDCGWLYVSCCCALRHVLLFYVMRVLCMLCSGLLACVSERDENPSRPRLARGAGSLSSIASENNRKRIV